MHENESFRDVRRVQQLKISRLVLQHQPQTRLRLQQQQPLGQAALVARPVGGHPRLRHLGHAGLDQALRLEHEAFVCESLVVADEDLGGGVGDGYREVVTLLDVVDDGGGERAAGGE